MGEWDQGSTADPVAPAVLVVHLDVVLLHALPEHVLQVVVVGGLLEVQGAAVDEQLLEHVRQVVAQPLYGDRQLLLHYLLVLLLLVVGLEVLPGHCPLHEVQQHVGDALQVVPPALLDAQVGVEGGEAGSAGQVLVVLVGDVVVVLEEVLLGEAEVDHVDLAGLLAVAHHEVVGLDVAVDVVALVDVLDALQHLQPHHQRRLQVELLPAHVEQVLQRLPAQVHHHHVVLPLARAVVYPREPVVDYVLVDQRPQDLGLVEQLGALGGGLLELDGVLGVVLGVDGHVDLPERPRPQLLRQLVVLRYDTLHLRVITNIAATQYTHQLKWNIRKNLWSMPPRIRRTTVQLSPFAMSSSTLYPSTVLPFRPYYATSVSNSLLMGSISVLDLRPLMERMTVTGPFTRSLLMFSMMRAHSGESRVQEQIDRLIWVNLPQRWARSMQASSTTRSRLSQARLSSRTNSECECTTSVMALLCSSPHSTITTTQQSPAQSVSYKTKWRCRPQRPLIHRNPPSYSFWISRHRTQTYSPRASRASRCCKSRQHRVRLRRVKVRMEVVSLGGISMCLACFSRGRGASLVDLGGQTGQVVWWGKRLKEQAWTEVKTEGRCFWSTVITQSVELLLLSRQASILSSATQVFCTKDRLHHRLFSQWLPMSTPPSYSTFSPPSTALSYFLLPTAMKEGGDPIKSASRSVLSHRSRLLQQWQCLAYTFSNKRGHMQRVAPDWPLTLTQAGMYCSYRLPFTLLLTQGMKSSMSTRRHALSWYTRSKQMPQGLTYSLSNI